MKAPQDVVEYANGRKKHRRATVWNHIREHVHDRRNALVLYLPGEGDIERQVAVARGFRRENLLPVERNPQVLTHLRRKGITAIDGELGCVVTAWPVNRPVAVVSADLQSNFSTRTFAWMMTWDTHPAFAWSVLYLNVQRGREAGEHMECVRVCTRGAIKAGVIDSKNRALAHCMMLNEVRARMGLPPLLCYQIDPYRSSGVVMDGAVIVNDGAFAKATSDPAAIAIKHGTADAGELCATRARVIAALAVRTRRMRMGVV